MAARRPSYDDLAELVQQQALEIKHLKQRVTELEAQLQAAHRQTAPFRRRESLKKPAGEKKRPGRPAGHEGEYRPQPPEIDQAVEVRLSGCPHCRRKLTEIHKRVQYIEEIPPVRPQCIQITTWTGVCSHCGDVESRHPLQTSTAVGAAGTHLGPRAQALAVTLAHGSGLTLGRTCRTLWNLCGLKLSRGGLAQLLQRVSGRLESYYERILEQIRQSAAVFADETSWYVGEPGWWLWIFTTPSATLYRVERSRGTDIPRETLGEQFAGTLVTDCLASYNALNCRQHKCIAHHLRVLKEHEETLEKRGLKSDYLHLWKLQLKDVIETWKQHQTLTPAAYVKKVLQLKRGVENLLNRSPPEPEEAKFRNRLLKQQQNLLGCLGNPAAEPTNNRAERDLRPAVIDRKLSCGNKTEAGKRAWEIVRSVVMTVHKQGLDAIDALVPHLRLAGR